MFILLSHPYTGPDVVGLQCGLGTGIIFQAPQLILTDNQS